MRGFCLTIKIIFFKIKKMNSVFIIFIGLAIGSFLNSVIYRLENDIPIFKFNTRSICPNCKKNLKWFELIPLISFLIQKGKCHGCEQKISWQYPIVEIATGLLFLSIFNFQFPIFNQLLNLLAPFAVETFKLLNFNFLIHNSLFIIQTIYLFVVSNLLILIFVFDFKYYIIPNQFVYSLIIISFIYDIFNSLFLIPNSLFNKFQILNSNFYFLNSKLGSAIFIALIFSLFFLSLTLVSRGRWMGMGDAKLVFFMGLFLGWPNIILALFSAFLLGTAVSLPLVFLNKKTFQSQIPFGPFLIIGTFIALFWPQYFLKFIL